MVRIKPLDMSLSFESSFKTSFETSKTGAMVWVTLVAAFVIPYVFYLYKRTYVSLFFGFICSFLAQIIILAIFIAGVKIPEVEDRQSVKDAMDILWKKYWAAGLIMVVVFIGLFFFTLPSTSDSNAQQSESTGVEALFRGIGAPIVASFTVIGALFAVIAMRIRLK